MAAEEKESYAPELWRDTGLHKFTFTSTRLGRLTTISAQYTSSSTEFHKLDTQAIFAHDWSNSVSYVFKFESTSGAVALFKPEMTPGHITVQFSAYLLKGHSAGSESLYSVMVRTQNGRFFHYGTLAGWPTEIYGSKTFKINCNTGNTLVGAIRSVSIRIYAPRHQLPPTSGNPEFVVHRVWATHTVCQNDELQFNCSETVVQKLYVSSGVEQLVYAGARQGGYASYASWPMHRPTAYVSFVEPIL